MDTTAARLSDSQVRSLLGFSLTARAMHVSDALSELPAPDRAAALANLLADLKIPIGELARGPVGLQRLTGLPERELNILRETTLLATVTDSTTSRAVLDALSEYGDLLQDDRFPDSTRLTGAVLAALANAARQRHHGVELGTCDTDSLLDALDVLAGAADIPDDIRTYACDTRGALY